MKMRDIILAIRSVRGWNQDELAERLGTEQNNVSRWESGVEPRGAMRDTIRELAEESGIVLSLSPSEGHTVPIMGRVGAGHIIEPDYEQTPPGGFYEIDLPVAVPEGAIGFEVKGDSMLPAYKEGDVIVVYGDPRRSIEQQIGDEAVVRTEDGKRFIKHLMPGTKRHRYTLLSISSPPILDVKVVWASPILARIPARQTRKVEPGHGSETPARRSKRPKG